MNKNKKQWTILSKEIRTEAGMCEVCFSKDHLQVHHWACSKFYMKSILRFERCNLICVCAKCHFKFHKNPIVTMEWMKVHRSADYIKCLGILNKEVN